MLSPGSYLDTVAAAIDRISELAPGHLDREVEHCPGFDVGKLLEHTGGFSRVVAGRVARDEEWVPPSGSWQQAPAEEIAGDPVGWHRWWGAALVQALRHADPAQPVVTWAGLRTRYFWSRRAAQELTIHRWDMEHACGGECPIDEETAVDGIDEFLGEFGEKAATLFDGEGETIQFVTDWTGVSFTVSMEGPVMTTNSHRTPDAVVRAPSDVLLRFVWGRAEPDDLVCTGDRALLERWHERVRI